MKNMMTVVLLMSGVVVSQINAEMMMKPEEIKAIRSSLEGKTIVQPQEMMAKWLQFKAEKLRLGSKEMNAFSDQFKDDCLKKEWKNTAKKIDRLAERFEDLSVPTNQKLIKSFAHADDWMKIAAKKMQLKSEQLRIIADQVADKNAKALLVKKSEALLQISRTLSEALTSPQATVTAPEVPSAPVVTSTTVEEATVTEEENE